MKNKNLILGVFLAITAIGFSDCRDSSDIDPGMGDLATIGSQVWTKKNLDVETYRNGDIIPQVQDGNAWGSLTTGAWCYYDNNAANGTKYGKIYNWYAVNDPRGLAPVGYHIPTDTEWTQLSDYLGGVVNASSKMKSTSGWYTGNGTNSSGFSGLPGGSRYVDGSFNNIEYIGSWWSSTEAGPQAWNRDLSYGISILSRLINDKEEGRSVRCLRD
jgi:uncharacterized protein (TIGR02145 family)